MLQILLITTPIDLLIALGYGTARLGWFDKPDTRVLGRFVANIAVPALLFHTLSTRPLAEILNGLNGRDITGKSPMQLNQMGVGRTFQTLQVFGKMSVRDNLIVADKMAGELSYGQQKLVDIAMAFMPEALDRFPRLKERLHSAASSLSGGEQKQLEVGRALLLRPKVILIDEPSIGLSPLVVADAFKLLRQLADPHIERLFLGGAHAMAAQPAATSASAA